MSGFFHCAKKNLASLQWKPLNVSYGIEPYAPGQELISFLAQKTAQKRH
jgi:hypothetical protein